MTELVWKKTETEKPTQEGYYRVMVGGDSEYLDGHCIYEFDDYEAWAYFDGEVFKGDHDEENDTIFAWCGPIVFPKYSEPTVPPVPGPE